MARILLVNPSVWGRGITPIWIASHAAALKGRGHDVELFDCTFYQEWSQGEIEFNTENRQYKPSDYFSYVQYRTDDVVADLISRIRGFDPDIIFFSAVSSHIHGEGEYVNIQYGYELINRVVNRADDVLSDRIIVAGGLQPTAQPEEVSHRFPLIELFIRGESELILSEIADHIDIGVSIDHLHGLAFRRGDEVVVNKHQEIIADLDVIPAYDYSLFEDQIFFRPYNGKVVRAIDYEFSRGCPYSCTYCVETVMQKYYGFDEVAGQGVIKRARSYLRNKSAQRIFSEIQTLHTLQEIDMIRCQDTNFLTIKKKVLCELADMFDTSAPEVFLYIETRPETITPSNVQLLKRLRVDGVGMGVELASESFRKSSLNRFPSQKRIVRAFSLLREAGIKRTTYNIIGLPGQNEAMILETIAFNSMLEPDNVTVAYYSPYLGTQEQVKSTRANYFDDYEQDVDGQIRSVGKSGLMDQQHLNFYKKYFVRLVREGMDHLAQWKQDEGLKAE